MGWTLPPFRALEQDNKIYGRGACDMKSGLACCTTAFIHAATIAQQKHKKPKRTLKLICTVDEEDFMRGIGTMYQIRMGKQKMTGLLMQSRQME